MLRMLGSPALLLGHQSMLLPQTRPAMLLLYLAFRGDWVSRDALATLFQPDEDDANARRYLRVLLNRAKDFAWAQQLEVSANALRWLVQTDASLLLEAFERKDWALVCQLHQKTLLEDFVTRDAPAFEAWCELERASLARLWQQAAMHHARFLTAANQPQEALRVLEQLLRFDPLQEDVVADSMRCQYALGNRQAALGAFEAFRKMLQHEMGLEPMPETLLLHGKINRSETLQTSAAPDRMTLERLNPVRFSGREREQWQLLKSQKSVRFVVAEAGAGKTRLLEQTVAAGAAWWYCREGLSDVPYHPITEWIRTHTSAVPELGSYLEDLARLIPEVAPTLMPSLPDPITAKTRLLEAITRVFETSQAGLVIDDLQWIDQSSLEALIFMVSSARVAVVMAARSEELSLQLEQTLSGWQRLDQLLTIKLEPLVATDAKELLDELVGTKAYNQSLPEWLVKHCGGNVFFMLETIREMLDSGNLGSAGHTEESGFSSTDIRVPQSVAALIEGRLARRSEIAQRVLQAGSVLREGLSAALLASMVGISEFAVVDALEEAERTGFICGHRFGHDLMRQSVYNSISASRRSALHARAATVLEPLSANLAVLSEHWHLAGNAQKAFMYLNLVSEDFYERGLFAESQSSLELVIRQAPDADSRLKAQQKQAWLLFELAQISQAKALNATVLQEAQNPVTQAQALHLEAVLLNHAGELEAARTSNQAAMQLMQRLQPDFVLFHATAASLAHASGDYQQAMDYLEPAVFQLRKQAISTNLISCLNGLGAAHNELGNHLLGQQYGREAWQMARSINAKSNQVSIAVNLAYALGQLGKPVEALQIQEEALSLGEYAMTNTLRNNLAQAYLKLGRLEEVKTLCHSIIADATDATLCCVNWMRLAKIHDLQNQPLEKHQAVQNGIQSLQNTEYEVARAAIAVGVFNYGTDTQIKWLEQFLSTHGFTSQMLRQRVEQTFTVKYGHSNYTF